MPGRRTAPEAGADTTAGPPPATASPQPSHGPQTARETPREWYDPEGFERDWYGSQEPAQGPYRGAPPEPAPAAAPVPSAPAAPATPFPAPVPHEPAPAAYEPAPVPHESGPAPHEPAPVPRTPGRHDETVTLRRADPRRAPVVDQGATEVLPVVVPGPRSEPGADGAEDAAEEPAEPPEAPTGGRAERRRAAKSRGRRKDDGRPAAGPGGGRDTPDRPLTRVEARRAAKAAKDSPAVVASRVVGELFITLGVLMLLFVTYQLWWTNVRADQIAGKETHKIQDDWAKGKRNPGVFAPGQGFAIIHIPKLDVVTPIAEGISKEKVLDRGMVGHYSEKPLNTAMPSDKQGNFALAGHRNTHGEPFRYINRLHAGDQVVVETQDAYYTYEMTSALSQTSPSNVSVIAPVPPQSGFKKPGRYITLTTCTPEFTSTYRLIVWGKMVDERPRSKGKPDALVD
ncbi:class E sortase [Streptomyces sp. NPDC059783]|uniref:class E sortase n=1 Tax=Streptomyces sp. NPDC059783 TaxID=3346944 RepID=UPI00366342A7